MKREELLDEIDDKRILFILNSNKRIDNDSEFAYYYALPDIRVFNNLIRRTSKYDTFLFVDKNTRFLEFSIYTVARQKLFTYSYSYSLNKNLNKLHTVLNNFRNQLNNEVIEAERIEKENIEFIKTTAEKLKRSKLLKGKNLQVNVVQKNKYVNVFFIYGKIKIKYTINPFEVQRTRLLKEMQIHIRSDFLIQFVNLLEKKKQVTDFEYETCTNIIKWYLDKSYSSKIVFLHLAIKYMIKKSVPAKYRDKVLSLTLMETLKD